MVTSDAADALAFEATAPAALRNAVANRPDAPFIIERDQRLAYAEAESRTRGIAAGLIASGVGKGSRVAILFPNSIEFALYCLAAARVGAVVIPVNTFSKPAEIAHQLRHCDAQILVTTSHFLGNDYLGRIEQAFPQIATQHPRKLMLPEAPHLRAIFVAGDEAPAWADPTATMEAMGADVEPALIDAIEDEVQPSDWLCVLYTSGSSAEPKGVIHSHGALLRRTASIARAARFGQDDIIYNPSPFFWLGGFSYLFSALTQGAALMVEPQFEAEATLAFLEHGGCTVALGWPHFGTAMRSHPTFGERNLSRIKGGNLRAVLRDEPLAGDPGLIAGGIGMTETAGQHAYPLDEPLPERLRGAFGYPAPGIEWRIIDVDSGQPLPEGEEGELCVRGYSVMQGYYKKEREETFDADGFFRTGDLGVIREGLYFFRGRRNDMIKTSGANVSPAEVRTAALAIPGVSDCFVTGLDDPLKGQVVAAAIVPERGAAIDLAAVTAALRQVLSAFKVPKVMRVVDQADIPVLPTAKIDRRALVKMLQDAQASVVVRPANTH